MFNVHEVSEIMGLCEDGIRYNIRSGALPAKKHGREWYVKKTDLLSFLKESYDILTDRQRAWYDRETGVGVDVEEAIRKIMRRSAEIGQILESDQKELDVFKQQLVSLYNNIPKGLSRFAEIICDEVSRKSGKRFHLDLTFFEDQTGKFTVKVEPRFEGGEKANG
jgi:hypothetical protein